ncbi:MAG: tetratricopeptide repeat protein [Nitrosomonadales bacterium]|nr:tetratricopeptide repeat protein [Nitrosomonadales bacterium]
MKPGRNDPCPCGSGKKTKKCCGGNEATARDAPAQAAKSASHSFNATNVATPSEPLLKAVALHQAGQLDEAAAAYRSLLKENPGNSDALHYLGLIAFRKEDYREAIALIGSAIKINSKIPAYHCNLGNALKGNGRFDSAIASFREAVSLDPEFQAAYSNLGNALLELERFDEATTCYRKALALRPDFAEAHYNLGNAFLEQYKLDDAIASYDNALALRPDYAAARHNKSNALLCGGVSRAAWQLYEYRLPSPGYAHLADCGLPLLGENAPEGKKILVQWEQRFGDMIQMMRYLPMLERIAGECWWQIAEPLRELVARSYPDRRIIGVTECPHSLDYRVPFTSLPLALKTFTEEAIPKEVPYLVADPGRVAFWKQRLRPDASPCVGVIWRGNPKPPGRSADINHVIPLLDDNRITFVTLQKDLPESERDLLGKYRNVISLDKELATFDDTASVIAALDLVITIDTAIAHLAGALGKPAWVLLKFGADWRWLRDREDSPWYPSARLFRQAAPGDWAGVMQRVRATLEKEWLTL